MPPEWHAVQFRAEPDRSHLHKQTLFASQFFRRPRGQAALSLHLQVGPGDIAFRVRLAGNQKPLIRLGNPQIDRFIGALPLGFGLPRLELVQVQGHTVIPDQGPGDFYVLTTVDAGVNFTSLIRAPALEYDEAISNSLMAKVKNLPISNQLRKYRKARGLKQCQVARILGLADASSLSHWEQGVRLPSVKNMFRLAALYRTLVDALYIDTLRTTREEIRKREVELFPSKDHAR